MLMPENRLYAVLFFFPYSKHYLQLTLHSILYVYIAVFLNDNKFTKGKHKVVVTLFALVSL